MWVLCRLASAVIGGLYPLFRSYKVLKKPTLKWMVHWLKYWVVYACFNVGDLILDASFVSCLIPFYEFLRVGVLVWLVGPLDGAQFTFDKVLAANVRRYSGRLEKWIIAHISSTPRGHHTLQILQNYVGTILDWLAWCEEEQIIDVPVQRAMVQQPLEDSFDHSDMEDLDNEVYNAPAVVQRNAGARVARAPFVAQVKEEEPETDDEIQMIAHYQARLTPRSRKDLITPSPTRAKRSLRSFSRASTVHVKKEVASGGRTPEEDIGVNEAPVLRRSKRIRIQVVQYRSPPM